jgi:predicted Zn finger-like uncharacterized protein
MTLATRCPACGTVFRVVPDQLRVSQGWVRCGRCSEAFNAQEALVEVPTPTSEADNTPTRSTPDSARFQGIAAGEPAGDGFTPPMPGPSSGPLGHPGHDEPGRAHAPVGGGGGAGAGAGGADVGIGVAADASSAPESSFDADADAGVAQAQVPPMPTAQAQPDLQALPEAPAGAEGFDKARAEDIAAAAGTAIHADNDTQDVVTSRDDPVANTALATPPPPIEPQIEVVAEGPPPATDVAAITHEALEPASVSDLAPMAALPAISQAMTTAPPEAPIANAAPAAGPDLIEIPHGMFVVATDGAVTLDFARPPDAAGPGDAAAAEHEPIDRSAAADEHLPSELPAFLHAPDPARAPSSAPAVNDPVLASIPAEELPATAPIEPVDKPSFLVQAERAARWQRPGVRLALFLCAVLGVAGLTAQVGYVFRDRVAVSMPTLKPLLVQACAAWGCRIDDYRQIDALSVESSGLTRVEGAPVYRLAVTLRNRADVEVAAPALDLSLTDALGQRIARRVLRMSDLGMPLRSLKPGSELPIQVPIGIADRPVSGYTVEIFYP